MLLFDTLSLYGCVYALGFLLFIFIKHPFLQSGHLSYRLFIALYSSVALIAGARIFYALVYETSYFINNPCEIIELYKGGMSFHGAILFFVASLFILDRKIFAVNLDRGAICAMLMLPPGRIVNFLNGELYGRSSTLPFSFIFEGGGEIARHPSQLYEAFAEGPLIAAIIFILFKRGKITKEGQIAFLFSSLYAFFRFFVEFTREPDLSVGFIASYFTAGQILCLIQLILTVFFYRFVIAKRHNTAKAD